MSAGRGRVALAALIVVGCALRFGTLDVQSLWRDEASTALAMRLSLGDLFHHIADLEGLPPLHFALTWLWAKVFGTGEVALRSVSAIAGTLTIPVAAALGRELGGGRQAPGLVAAALVATSPFLVWFSQEARPYALLVLFTALATLYFARGLSDPAPRVPLYWGAAAAAALATHYFALFLLGPQAVVLLWRAAAGRRVAARGLAIFGVAGVALGPLVLAQSDGRVDWVGEIALRTRLTDVPKHWAAGPFGTPADVAGLAAILIALAGLVLAFVHLRRSFAVIAVAACVAAALAGPLVVAVGGPDYVLDRYLIAALVPLLALAGAGLAAAGRRGVVAAAVLAVMFTAFTVDIAVDDELHREDWREVAARLKAAGGPTAIVATPDAVPGLRYYLGAEFAVAAVPAERIATVGSWRFGRARQATPAPPVPGFELASRADLPTATLVVYAAPARTPVDPAALRPATLDPTEPVFVLVSPGA